MIVKSEHTVQEVFNAMDAAHEHWERSPGKSFRFHGDSRGMRFNSARMINFRINGVKCKHCGIEGTIFRKEKHKESGNRWHLNLYAVNPQNGGLILMTRDHIIPTSRGGPNTLENSQPLCSACNRHKGNSLPGEFTPRNYRFGYKKKRERKKSPRNTLTWERWRRRLKFFFYTSWEKKKIVWPICVGENGPSIKSFWKY